LATGPAVFGGDGDGDEVLTVNATKAENLRRHE
jgi:hypothetical protein